MRRALAMFALAAALLPAPPVWAQQPASQANLLLTTTIVPGLTLERYLEQRRTEFTTLDLDGDGAVTPADVDFARASRAAEGRATIITTILRSDLDGDGIVTREETRQSLSQSIALVPIVDRSRPGFDAEFEAAIVERMRGDLNGDGRIEGAEMLAYAKQKFGAGPAPGNSMLTAASEFDEDRDGRTTEVEFLKAAEIAFRTIDVDGDGTMSKDEIETHRRQSGQGR